MTTKEMNRVLAAFPDFSWTAESKTDGLFGGWEGYDQYGYKKGKWTCFDDNSRSFKISDKSEQEFMEYLKQEADGDNVCIDGMSIYDYVKNVRKDTPLEFKKRLDRFGFSYDYYDTIPGSEIEDWILEHDSLSGIDPYTYLKYDHSVDYSIITNYSESGTLIYPKNVL